MKPETPAPLPEEPSLVGRLRKSTLWSTAEVVVSGLLLFALLKLILWRLGVEALGIWSLVLATTLLVRVGDASISAVVPRFVGEASAVGEQMLARRYLDTAMMMSLAIHAVMAIALWVPLNLAIGSFAPTGSAVEAQHLLPYALIAFVAVSVAQTAQAGVVGLHHAHWKSAITLIGLPFQLGIAWLLIDRLGLLAVIVAQFVQTGIVIILSRLASMRLLGSAPTSAFLFRVSRGCAGQIWISGMKMQLTQLATLGFEPLLKFALSAKFGLHALAYFEIANRIIAQLRQLAVMPALALVPAFAATRHSERRTFEDLYSIAMANIMIFAILMSGTVILASPAISFIMLGTIDPAFIAIAAATTAGWMINACASPAFFAAISVDVTRWNTLGQLFATLATPLAIAGLASTGSASLAVLAAMSCLAAGSIIMIVMNCRSIGIAALPTHEKMWAAVQRIVAAVPVLGMRLGATLVEKR